MKMITCPTCNGVGSVRCLDRKNPRHDHDAECPDCREPSNLVQGEKRPVRIKVGHNQR